MARVPIGTTQVAQERPPRAFRTSKRRLSTTPAAALLCGTQWELPGLPGWDGTPARAASGSPGPAPRLAQGAQLPPPGHFWNKLERSARGGPTTRGCSARRGPRLAAATDSAAEVDLVQV